MDTILLYIVTALSVATILNIFLKRLGVSHIIGYIVTGTLLAYAFGIREENAHSLELVGEFGIVFLMFTIGLEMSLATLKTMKKLVFVNGALQVGISGLIFYLFAYYLFSISMEASLIIASALALSSTAIVLTYLKENKGIYAPYGRQSTGILIFQDIAVIPILLMIGFLANDGDNLQGVLFETFVSAVVVIGLLFVVGKRVVAWLLHFSADSKLDELFMGSVLMIVIGASLLAHLAGFTYSLGAFVAGMIIAETKYLHKVEADIAPFKDLLLGLFFITVGMKIDLLFFAQHALEIIGLFAVVVFIKGAIIHLIISSESKSVTGFKTAVTLSQVGEFSFAIFALASSNHLLEPELSQMLVLMVVLSMIATPFILAKRKWLQDIIFKRGEIKEADLTGLAEHKDHVIVCGYGKVGQKVAKRLRDAEIEHVVIENNYALVQKAAHAGEEIYYGDISKASVLHALHVENAASVIITLEESDRKLLVCEALYKYKKDLNMIVEVDTSDEKRMFYNLDSITTVYAQDELATILVQKSMKDITQ
ncbi:MAG: cation:proton antiporter [Campylobacterota bacterium]|nr:cation:proton antiporter [Campylobacterota bacterium]